MRDLGTIIEEAYELLSSKPYISLSLACTAVDISSKRYRNSKNLKGNSERFRKFAKDFMPIIMSCGRLKLIVEGDIKIGNITMQDLLYKLVRCCLIHEGAIDEKVVLSEDEIGSKNNKIIIKSDIIEGLLLASILCEDNRGFQCENNFQVELLTKLYPVNSLWGNENLFWNELKIIASENHK